MDETMVYRAIIANGQVRLHENVHLPEGSAVEIMVMDKPARAPFGERYAKYIGDDDDQPADLSENLDRHLYGQPDK